MGSVHEQIAPALFAEPLHFWSLSLVCCRARRNVRRGKTNRLRLSMSRARASANERRRVLAPRRANHLEKTMRKVALLSTESKKHFVRCRKALADQIRPGGPVEDLYVDD
jgi:hypothetical protein